MNEKEWNPTEEDNLGIITNIYDFIKGKLSELQEETGCPDSFIYNFVGSIQNEWHPDSCHSLVRNNKRIN